jgi:outer membrane lipoprotein-sorting protein
MGRLLRLFGKKNIIMARNKSFRIAVVTIICCLLYCCTSQQITIPPSSLHPSNKEISPDEVISVLQKRAEKITTVKSTLSMTIQSKELAQPKKLKGFIAVRKPGVIRFKGFTFLGLTLFDLVIGDNDFQLFLPSKNELYQGNREDAYNSPISLPLLPDDITSIFYSDLYESPHLHCWEEEDYYLLSSARGGETTPLRSKKLWIEKGQLTIVTMEVYNRGELDTRYSFDNYKLVGENYFPYAVEIERVTDGSFIKIAIDTIELNHPIDPEAFRINADTIKSINTLGKE